jgi:hypothetical protein
MSTYGQTGQGPSGPQGIQYIGPKGHTVPPAQKPDGNG